MNFAMEYGALTIEMDMIATVAFACILYLIGRSSSQKSGFYRNIAFLRLLSAVFCLCSSLGVDMQQTPSFLVLTLPCRRRLC